MHKLWQKGLMIFIDKSLKYLPSFRKRSKTHLLKKMKEKKEIILKSGIEIHQQFDTGKLV